MRTYFFPFRPPLRALWQKCSAHCGTLWSTLAMSRGSRMYPSGWRSMDIQLISYRENGSRNTGVTTAYSAARRTLGPRQTLPRTFRTWSRWLKIGDSPSKLIDYMSTSCRGHVGLRWVFWHIFGCEEYSLRTLFWSGSTPGVELWLNQAVFWQSPLFSLLAWAVCFWAYSIIRSIHSCLLSANFVLFLHDDDW